MGLFEELKRRNVIRVGIAYAVTAWLLLQIADLVLDNIGSPLWVMQAFMLLLGLGFPLSLLFAWAFEITPEGIKREAEVDRDASITHVTGRKLDFGIIALLVVVAGYFFWESRFTREHPPAEAPVAAAADAARAPSAADTTGSTPAPVTASGTPSIAVLPFVNLSSDPEQEFFSDGISEELLNVLAQFSDLRVAARTSSFQFKGDNRNISDIASQLNVNHVLEGSVRKAGNRLRITAQLIEAEHGYHLWSETYDRELNDVFAIQDEISLAISEALRAELELENQGDSGPKVAATANTAAYEAYLHGRYLINQRGNKAITQAVQELERSVRLDPEYAPARAQLAIAYTLLHNSPSSYGDLTTAQVIAKATPHIDRAFALTETLAEAWGAKCQLASTQEDFQRSVEYCQRALELNPAYIDAMNWINNSALLSGQYQLAYSYIKRIQEVDPLSVIGRLNYAGMFLGHTDPERAHRIADDLLEVSTWAGHSTHANVSASEGNIAESLRWSLLAFRDNPLDTYSHGGLAGGLSIVGLVSEARRISDYARTFAAATPEEFAEARGYAETAVNTDPDNTSNLLTLAYNTYYAGDLDAALPLYRQIHEIAAPDLPTSQGYSLHPGLRYAWLLRRTGDESGARQLLTAIEKDLDSREGTPLTLFPSYIKDRIVLTWLNGDEEGALTQMAAATPSQLAPRNELLDPLLAPSQQDPRFVAQLERYDAWASEQREEVLTLICENNPIPDSWLPLPETCQGFNTAAR
ncbi:hypothetical protein FV139_12475 [Parahaliea maris]|uniref:Tetratricopeptide repeat protein n=1 Tax=Parahaliea maris TaxID=2716870 RepID=A0A5C8ZW64_9GAMM|nr:hypothetical protein [Parahaliea maris]TXS92783.1 hypothetical protein FV139_12475 [Parahaliea maris]